MVAPNPLVGCVIVRNNEIVSEGHHKQYGGPHAEVNAINNLSPEIDPKDCTLFVNLEPCSHFGKTPPCADLIIKKGFKKVVISNLDPNPLVAGQGISNLKKAGIEVISGVLEKEGFEINKRFFTFHSKHRPYIILKWAQTADGFISRLPVPELRSENMIGNREQQIISHTMRSEEMAIMVGKNTVLCDNPGLTTRLVKGRNSVRIFVDKNLEVPQSFNVYNEEAETIVFNDSRDDVNNNIRWIRIDFDRDILPQIMQALYKLNIQSVLIEGGAVLLNSFLKSGLWDEAIVFMNENLRFENGVEAPKIQLPLKFDRIGEMKIFKLSAIQKDSYPK